MKAIIKFTDFFKKVLPSPFSLAVLLTYLIFLLALFFTPNNSSKLHFFALLDYWSKGFWELLAFTGQMMLILVLGYVLALTKPVNSLINSITGKISSITVAAFWVTFFTVLFGYINWGLGLIFGAVFARKLAESFSARKLKFNYPLIGAAGYTGLLVWHGGLSGSAPLKVAENEHFLFDKIGLVPLSETILSPMNITLFFVFLIILPLTMYFLAKKSEKAIYDVKPEIIVKKNSVEDTKKLSPGEKPDNSKLFSLSFAILFFGAIIYIVIKAGDLSFLNLNFINFTLFALGILLTPNIKTFTSYISKSISASSGILIQFPLYAGIMGVMKYSGLFMVFTDAFINVANSFSLPVLTFFSAGLINFFVPSGGGQWVVQGPVIVEAAKELGVPVSKIIMAMAYGDEWTNMLQPFWALPLLGITGLKAKDIVPFTFVLFLVSGLAFVAVLIL